MNSIRPAIHRRKIPAIALAIALVAALLGTFAYLGLGTASADEPEAFDLEDPSITQVDEAELRRILASEPNEAWFWSGRINGESMEQLANDVARQNGGVTLEGRLRDEQFEMPPFDAGQEARDTWILASRIWAEQASGDVFAAIGPQVREGAVFATIELPALRANPDVNTVTQLQFSDDPTAEPVRTVIFDRNNPGNGDGDGEGDGEDPPTEDPAPGEGDPDEGDDAATFSIQGKGSGKCVDLAEVENGANPTLQDCNGTDRQRFFLDNSQLKANLGGKEFCFSQPLSVQDKLTVSGCNLPNQLTWTFEDSSEWHVNNTNKCLDARQERVDNGTEIIIFECGARANQQWSNIQ